MINIDINKLNPLEQKIHTLITDASQHEANLTITQSAHLCNCSVSKISKFVQKLGFQNYKQYMNFLYGNELVKPHTSNELDRIRHFLDEFDFTLVDAFIHIMNTYDKIILFGYGPSFICTQYFEYKLRLATNKVVISVPDEVSAENLIDDKSLLVIFSTTGKFKSFEHIYNYAKKRHCKPLLIVEEYNTSLLNDYDNVFLLTKSFQSTALSPYEKSRTIFFIFIEEVIQHLLKSNEKES